MLHDWGTRGNRPMKVLVTGGCGLVGKASVDRFLGAGHAVRVFELPTRANRRVARRWNGRCEVQWGDIRDSMAVQQAVHDQDVVIHNAGVLPPVSERNPALAQAVNVDGTRLLLDAMEVSDRRPRLIFSSSVSLYGPRLFSEPPVTDTLPLCPVDHYTHQKMACEEMVRASSIPWSIFRIGVVLDPQTRETSADAFRTIFSMSPENRMEVVHARDIGRAQVHALATEEAWGRVLLIGGGESCRVRQRDLLSAIWKAMALRPLPESCYGDAAFYTDWMDTGESQRILRFQETSFLDYVEELCYRLRHVRRLLWPLRPLIRHRLKGYARDGRRTGWPLDGGGLPSIGAANKGEH